MQLGIHRCATGDIDVQLGILRCANGDTEMYSWGYFAYDFAVSGITSYPHAFLSSTFVL